jgi:hypothetical protein
MSSPAARNELPAAAAEAAAFGTSKAGVGDVFAEEVQHGLEVGLVPTRKCDVKAVTRRQLLQHAAAREQLYAFASFSEPGPKTKATETTPAHNYRLLTGERCIKRLLVAELLEQFVDWSEF